MERQMGCSSLANFNFDIRAGLHRQHLLFFSLESAVSGIWKFFSCRCLPEVSIGVIVDVNPIEERKVPGGKVDMLSIRLKDISGNTINVTLWGRHATIFEDTLKGNLCDATDPNVAVITSTTSKRYQGDLSLNSSSSTKIYVNIDIPEAAELIQSFKSTNVLHSSANASLTNSAILDKTRTISEILSSAVSGSNTAAVLQQWTRFLIKMDGIMSHVLSAKKVLLLQKHTSSVNSVMKVWITPLQAAIFLPRLELRCCFLLNLACLNAASFWRWRGAAAKGVKGQ